MNVELICSPSDSPNEIDSHFATSAVGQSNYSHVTNVSNDLNLETVW
jgi:hypothetical protein